MKRQQKTFHIQKHKKKNKFLVYLAILNSERIFENFNKFFISISLDIYIKMGPKEPLVERNGFVKEFYIQLESTAT